MILELLKENKFDEAIKLLAPKDGVDDYKKEYENDRTVRKTQVGKRVDKSINSKTIAVAKIPIPFQPYIVQIAASFLFGSPISITSNSEKHQEIMDLWNKLRMDSLLLKFAEIVKSETEAAIVLFSRETVDKTIELRAKLLSRDEGAIMPYFDNYGDMEAFGWKYEAIEGDKKFEFLYLFTVEKTYQFKNDGGWKETEESKPNLFGKIPVIYQSQKYPEWWLVKEMIDRFESNLSKNLVDSNDYFGSPMFKSKGSPDQLPEKDDTGKMIILPIVETDSGKLIESDVEVLAVESAPESIKLEFDTEKDLIFGLTNTPDLSFNNMKGLGNIAGVALELMFLGPIIKAKYSEGDYSTTVKRILSVMVAGMSRILKTITEAELKELVFTVKFNSVLPDNIQEIVSTLTTANGGKPIISQQSSVRRNPMIHNADEEINLINQEANVDSQSDIFNPTV